MADEFAKKNGGSGDALLIIDRFSASIGGNIGRLYNKNGDFYIDYIPSQRYFYIEISSIESGTELTDLASAKQRVIDWLLAQGFKDSDICDLKITFFLSDAALNLFVNKKIEYWPLVDGCFYTT